MRDFSAREKNCASALLAGILLVFFSSAPLSGQTLHGFSGFNREVEALVYQDIAAHRQEIEWSCRYFGVDAKVLYAILAIENMQDRLNIIRRTKDRVAGSFKDFRLFEDELYRWARLSTGYTHIKPSFALETWRRLAAIPQFQDALTEEDVRPSTYTADARTAIKIAAAGLFVLQRQWLTSPSHIDLGRRPDILATLYNLGFEKSHPHPDPRPGGSLLPFIVDGRLIEGTPFGEKVNLLIQSRTFQDFIAGGGSPQEH